MTHRRAVGEPIASTVSDGATPCAVTMQMPCKVDGAGAGAGVGATAVAVTV